MVLDLTGRGVKEATAAPPFSRMLWKLGIDAPPPLFAAFGINTLVMGGCFGFFL